MEAVELLEAVQMFLFWILSAVGQILWGRPSPDETFVPFIPSWWKNLLDGELGLASTQALPLVADFGFGGIVRACWIFDCYGKTLKA
jgi:hypothetical protein